MNRHGDGLNDQTRRAAEHERLRVERLERYNLAAEHELQRLAVQRTAGWSTSAMHHADKPNVF